MSEKKQATVPETVVTPPSTGPGPVQDEIPLSNEVAKANLEAGTDPKQRYIDAFGERIGGFLWDQIQKNLNGDKIDSYLQKGGDAGADWLHEQLIKGARPEDLAQIQELGPHLKSVIGTSLVAPLQRTGLGNGVESWASNNPWGVAGLGTLGVGAYIASNPDLSFDPRLSLSENHSVSLGGDFGQLFDPSVDALRTGYRYRDPQRQLDLKGETRFDKDQWSLGANYKQQAGWGQWSAFLDHTNTDNQGNTTGGVDVDHERYKAFLRGGYDSKSDLGSISGGFSTLNKDGPTWTGGFDANTRGAWNANLGISERQKNLEWFAKIGAGQDEFGKSDVNAQAGLKLSF